MLLFRLIKQHFHATLAIVILAGKVNSKFCNGGHICSPPKECCPLGCCLVLVSPGYRPAVPEFVDNPSSMSTHVFWHQWFFWILLAILVLLAMCGCGLWRKRQYLEERFFGRNGMGNDEERSELDSTGSCYPPPQYSRCSSFHYAPPPYTEVTSKPDLYPLVISYKPENGKISDNCVMVQYFRNYVVHPALGSLSAGSTVDSISSSFFNQSVHESETNFPPTYEESRLDLMENRSLAEIEPLNPPTSLRCQQTFFLTQGQLVKNTDHEGFVESNEIQQVIVENIQQSIQKASTTVTGVTKMKSNLPETFKNFKTLQNSTQSLPSNLCFEPTTNQKKVARPNNLYISTFKRMNKSIIFSGSTDSITGNNPYSAHQYTSDVILAQPESYCDSNNELHYYSSDILNNSNFLRHVNNSYSSEDNLSQPRGSLQDFVSSDGLSHSQFSNLEMNNFSTSSDVSSLQGCGSPDSPPRATSPTGEFRNLLDKIQQLPIHKDSSKLTEGKNVSFSNCKVAVSLGLLKVDNPSDGSEELSENESVEKCRLLNESAQSTCKPKPKKPGTVRPNKLIAKQNFPSRSKTHYMPFCHSTLSLKKKGNSLSSTSAPVTPVSNAPSPGSAALSFASTVNKFGSKNKDGRPLLCDEGESNDEVF